MILTGSLRTLARAELSVFGRGRFSTNPSILRMDDGYLCLVKGVNFDLEAIRLSGDWQAIDPREPIDCRYKMVHLDAAFQTIDVFDLDTTSVDRTFGAPVGVEDLRLFWRNDAIFVCGCVIDREAVFTGVRWIIGSPKTRVFVAEVVLDRLEGVQIFESPTGAREEKNWMAVSRGASLDFVVNVGRDGRLSTDGAGAVVSLSSQDCLNWRGWSGSTCLVSREDGYIALIHRKSEREPYCYKHMFVIFDKQLKARGRSALFSFEGRPVEFCCGLDCDRETMTVSYGVMDKSAVIAVFPREDIIALPWRDIGPGDLDELGVEAL